MQEIKENLDYRVAKAVQTIGMALKSLMFRFLGLTPNLRTTVRHDASFCQLEKALRLKGSQEVYFYSKSI